MDPLIVLLCADTAGHLIGIKHKDQLTWAYTPIIAQNIHECLARLFQAALGEFLQILPCKNDIISVNQQVFHLRLFCLDRACVHGRLRLTCGRALEPRLYRPVCAFKDCPQLLIAHGSPRRSRRRCRCLGRRGHDSGLDMHHGRRIPPRHCIPRTVRTEYGIRGVLGVSLRIISDLFNHTLLLSAGRIPAQCAQKPSLAVCVCSNIACIMLCRSDGCPCIEQSTVRQRLRCIKPAAHLCDIIHGTPDTVSGQLKAHVIPWLEQDASRLHEPLAHCAVGCLAEVTALRMLKMRTSGDQRDLHIRQRRTGQYAAVCLFHEVCQDQALPVPVKIILRYRRRKPHSAAPRPGFEQQMHFSVMPQRFIMSYAFDSFLDRLAIQDPAGVKGHRKSEPIL